MSLSKNNGLPSDSNSPATARSLTSPAQTSVFPDKRPLSEDDHSMASPSLPVDSQRPSFSPADCRTLQRILHDVRSPSPLSPTPYFGDKPSNRLNLTATVGSDANEDKMSCEDDWSARADERLNGYEDEDDSMELSDGEDALGVDEENGDTIEDVVNVPGKTAPLVPVQDYISFCAHDQPTPDGAEEPRLCRASNEKDLEKQYWQQERVQITAAADGVYDVEKPTDSVPNHGLVDEEICDLEDLDEDIKIYGVEEQRVAISALDSSGAFADRPRASVSSSDIQRVSEGTQLTSTSFITFPSPACAVVQTPNSKHIDFASSVPVPNTLVDSTLNYFEAQEGEDFSPSKHQRNALSPKEIAKLAREARVKEEEVAEQRELAELDQFRDMDLAPIETVMEGGPAGDLIMCGTPVKAKDEELFSLRASDTSDSKIEDWNHTQRLQFSIPSPRRHTLVIEQEDEKDADVEGSDTASSSEQRQLAAFPRRPTFVTVIGMLPATMFWATVALLFECSSMVFDMIIERLTGLKV